MGRRPPDYLRSACRLLAARHLMEMKRSTRCRIVTGTLLLNATVATSTAAQDRAAANPAPAYPAETEPVNAARQVDVQPSARDDEVAVRLTRILASTQWFLEPRVAVENGVAFLQGMTTSDNYEKWAGTLAQQMQDVAVFVNQLEAIEGP